MKKSRITFLKKFFVPAIGIISLFVIFALPVEIALAQCPPQGGPANQTESFIDPASGRPSCRVPSNITTIAGLLNRIIGILNLFIPFLIGLGVFLIIFGILRYIVGAADEEKRKEGRDFIMWGVIGVFIMLSVWGLVSILYNSFNLDRSTQVIYDIYGVARDASGKEISNLSLPAAGPTTLIDLITRVNIVGSRVLPFLVSIGLFIVIFGIIKYIRQAANEEKRAEGRMFILWGVIFIFIMISVFGFVNILVNTLKLNNTVPSLGTGTNSILHNIKIP